jgi:hypothetical protein
MPDTPEDKRAKRTFTQETIPEMCAGCIRGDAVVGRCKTIREPGHFYETYGYCFAKITSIQEADNIETDCDDYEKAHTRINNWISELVNKHKEAFKAQTHIKEVN